ncbi:MAG TPA: hypothetical protein PKD63_02375 [Solirubrobacteraceae bacterium]|nr:hypothetical protein [Solirubrobacteraceae bacterium]
MLVLTPSGHLAYVVAQARGLSRVLLFETYTENLVRTADLRPAVRGQATSAIAA